METKRPEPTRTELPFYNQTMTESTVTKNIVAYLKSVRERGEPIWWVKLHGSPAQRAGLPDLIVLYRGRLIAVEIKRPGKKATRLQTYTLEAMRAAGALCCVATCVGDVKVFFE